MHVEGNQAYVDELGFFVAAEQCTVDYMSLLSKNMMMLYSSCDLTHSQEVGQQVQQRMQPFKINA